MTKRKRREARKRTWKKETLVFYRQPFKKFCSSPPERGPIKRKVNQAKSKRKHVSFRRDNAVKAIYAQNKLKKRRISSCLNSYKDVQQESSMSVASVDRNSQNAPLENYKGMDRDTFKNQLASPIHHSIQNNKRTEKLNSPQTYSAGRSRADVHSGSVESPILSFIRTARRILSGKHVHVRL